MSNKIVFKSLGFFTQKNLELFYQDGFFTNKDRMHGSLKTVRRICKNIVCSQSQPTHNIFKLRNKLFNLANLYMVSIKIANLRWNLKNLSRSLNPPKPGLNLAPA